jgi:4-amino-4-deoxy-L-arabinose transferase-like glycosyltransferase
VPAGLKILPSSPALWQLGHIDWFSVAPGRDSGGPTALFRSADVIDQMAPPIGIGSASQFAGGVRAAAWFKTPAGGLTILMLATFLVRLLFAGSLGLGIDESYMVAAGRHLQLSYFDHPPIAWWLAWAAAHIAGADSAVVVRLPFIALFALTTWLMYRVTAALFGAKAGLWAAVAANLCPVIGVTAGTWVLPDGPLFAALLGAALCLIASLPAEGSAAWGWWLGAGFCAGLALASKYSAGLTILGAIGFLLTERDSRRWLLRPHPYVAGLAALLMVMPVLIWNARHGWVSFLFQGSRAEGRFNPLGPVSTLAGAALFLLPWVWLALMWCGFDALRRGPADKGRWLLVCLAMPPIIFFTLVSFRSRVLFHWAAPGYLMLVPMLGDAIARRRGSRRWVVATGALVVFGMAFVATEVRFNWLPLVIGDFRPGKDPALAAVDWTSVRTELAERGLLDRPGLVVAATRWLDAGKIDYALGGRATVICLGSDPREYGIVAPIAQFVGADVLIVAPGFTTAKISVQFGPLFESIEKLAPATLLHAERPAMIVPLFIGRGLRNREPAREAAGGTVDSP